MDEWMPVEAVRASRSTERTPRHRMLSTRTPHRVGLAMRARIGQQPRSDRRRAMSETGPESQRRYVLRTARDLLDRQARPTREIRNQRRDCARALRTTSEARSEERRVGKEGR